MCEFVNLSSSWRSYFRSTLFIGKCFACISHLIWWFVPCEFVLWWYLLKSIMMLIVLVRAARLIGKIHKCDLILTAKKLACISLHSDQELSVCDYLCMSFFRSSHILVKEISVVRRWKQYIYRRIFQCLRIFPASVLFNALNHCHRSLWSDQ